MTLWCEFWFLVSTTILAFVIWRYRKKKLFKIDGNALPSIKTRSMVRSGFSLLFFMGFSYFSIFSQFGSEISIIKQTEVGVARSQVHSIIFDKTFEITTLRSYGVDQDIPLLLNLVLTKTDFSYDIFNLGNFLTSFSGSPGNSLEFSCSRIL